MSIYAHLYACLYMQMPVYARACVYAHTCVRTCMCVCTTLTEPPGSVPSLCLVQ